MVSTPQQRLKFACSACGAKYEVPLKMAGKQTTCAKCGQPLLVPRESSGSVDRKLAVPPTEYVPVECRVCQTRYYGRPDQVGSELKCPDCGARNLLRPPPKPRPQKQPPALEGEQYEVYALDAQPLPAEIAAAQPKYIAVKCSCCDTLMHATPEQVGQSIRCPDCGTEHLVPPPHERTPFAFHSDAPDLEIDPSLAPGPPPPVIRPPVRRMLYEEEEEDAAQKRPPMWAPATSARLLRSRPMEGPRRRRFHF